MQQSVTFPSGTVKYLFQSSVDELPRLAAGRPIVVVTDEHVAKLYPKLKSDYKCLIIPASENSKDIAVIDKLTKDLLRLEATRNTLLAGIGGGVVTDITGFLASIYMRGVQFGFVPTTLLGMVDAAIGGKNGINTGLHKNILGTIKQPEFILYDARFLGTLPDEEWSNGFAEVIKYACLFDAPLFDELSNHNVAYYKMNAKPLEDLVEKCAGWKNKIVQADEHEQKERKLLNFGHTLAHAIEKLYSLAHGKAVSIGMAAACTISQSHAGLDKAEADKLKKLLQQYGLPVSMELNAANVIEVLRMDKKRNNDTIDYILLEKIGKGAIRTLPMKNVEQALIAYDSNC